MYLVVARIEQPICVWDIHGKNARSTVVTNSVIVYDSACTVNREACEINTVVKIYLFPATFKSVLWTIRRRDVRIAWAKKLVYHLVCDLLPLMVHCP